MKVFKNPVIVALLIATAFYLIFFYKVFSPVTGNTFIGYGTTDATSYQYPIRYYLWDKITNDHVFPFFTQRIFLGFPIYANSESGYLNIVNVLSILALGPFYSYTLLHFLSYLAGCFCFFKFFLKKKIGLIGYSAGILIYYFSFYHILRTQLFNTILITFLIPCAVYLVSEYFDTNKLRYIFLNIVLITHCIYLGQFNFVFLLLLAEALYVVSISSKESLKKQAVFVTLNLYFIVVLSLPTLLPARELFEQSDRGQNSNIYLEGSYSPIILLSSFFPYIFGDGDNYIGHQINNDYIISETYLYVSVLPIICLLLYLLFAKNSQEKYFVSLLTSTFLILGFLKNIPYLENINLPIINLFRYWGRAYVLLLFGLSFSTAYVLENFTQYFYKNFRVKNLIFPFVLIFYVILIFVINYSLYENQTFIRYLLTGGLTNNWFFKAWLALSVLEILALVAYLKFKTRFRIIKSLPVLALLINLLVFSRGFLNANYFQRVSEIIPKYNVSSLESSRVLYLNTKKVYANVPLYFKTWGMTGYMGPYEPKKYIDFLNANGISTYRRANFPVNSKNEELLKKLGFVGYFDKLDNYVSFSNNSGIFVNMLETSSIQFETLNEDYISAKFSLKQPQVIHTTFLPYKDLYLTVDGNRQEFLRPPTTTHVPTEVSPTQTPISWEETSPFYRFSLPAGEHIVEIRYYPKTLIWAVGLSLCLLIPGILATVYFVRSQKLREILN